jgi:hypothetical protein
MRPPGPYRESRKDGADRPRIAEESVHPYLMQTLSRDRISDWQRRAEQDRWLKESRHARPARQARAARELVAAALAPLGIRRMPPAQDAAARAGTAEGQPAVADRHQSAGSRAA